MIFYINSTRGHTGSLLVPIIYRPKEKLKVQERCNGQANHHTCHPETPFVVRPYIEKRRHECCKASNDDEGGREETSRKAQTEVDGQSAERYETTPAQSKARTEQRAWRKAVMAIDPGQG